MFPFYETNGEGSSFHNQRVQIEVLGPRHVAGVVGLQAACFPPPFPAELLWSEAHLLRHMEIFPAGQFVAVRDGAVIGSASSLIIGEESWRAHKPWEETTGGHFLPAHDPMGTTLYGADVSVHPEFRGQGVARALYEARFELVRSLGLTRYGTACRLPGFQASGLADQAEYCRQAEKGERTDPTLTPLLRLGCRLVAIARGYMDDPESGDAAAVLEWVP